MLRSGAVTKHLHFILSMLNHPTLIRISTTAQNSGPRNGEAVPRIWGFNNTSAIQHCQLKVGRPMLPGQGVLVVDGRPRPRATAGPRMGMGIGAGREKNIRPPPPCKKHSHATTNRSGTRPTHRLPRAHCSGCSEAAPHDDNEQAMSCPNGRRHHQSQRWLDPCPPHLMQRGTDWRDGLFASVARITYSQATAAGSLSQRLPLGRPDSGVVSSGRDALVAGFCCSKERQRRSLGARYYRDRQTTSAPQH